MAFLQLVTVPIVKCCCGKTCNSLRGLKLHHRSCRVILGLGNISIEDVRVDSNDSKGVDCSVQINIANIMPVIKPGIAYDLSPLTYQQITKAIRRIKASGSPCPINNISIIPYKRCAYLRSFITEIIRAVWICGEVPQEWKIACTILIHKNGDTSEPDNFRPITVESVPFQTSEIMRKDSMFTFLSQNGYIEHHIQKDFFPNVQVLSSTLHKSLTEEPRRKTSL